MDKIETKTLHQEVTARIRKLHVLIQEISGNKILIDVLNGLRQKILLHRHRQLNHKDRFKKSRSPGSSLKRFAKDSLVGTCKKRHLTKQCKAIMGYKPSQK